MVAASLVLFLSLTFLISAIPKIFYIKDFIELVRDYKVLNRRLSSIYGLLLPFTELITAVLLILEQTLFYGLLMSILVLLSFGIAVLKVTIDKRKITCGCYGKFFEAKADKFTLFKVVLLLIMSFSLLLFSRNTNLEWGFFELALGIIFYFCLICMQFVWSHYNNSIKLLKF